MAFEYSVPALVAAHTSFRVLLDAEVGAASIKIRSLADTLLAEVALTDPCGTVAAETGQLSLTPTGPDLSAAASGTASYAEVCDGLGVVHLTMPCAAGISAQAGYCVLNSLSIVGGGSVEILSATIG